MIRLPHEMPATPAAAESLAKCGYRFAKNIHDDLPPSANELMASKFRARAGKMLEALNASDSDDAIELPKPEQSEVDGWLNTLVVGVKVDKFNRMSAATWKLFDPDQASRVLGVVMVDLLLWNDKQAIAITLDTHTTGKRDQLAEGTFDKPGKIKQERGTSIPKDLPSRWMLHALRHLAKSKKYKVATYYAHSGHWCETSWVEAEKIDAVAQAVDAEIAATWAQLNGELSATACDLCAKCRYVTTASGGDGSCPYWKIEEEKKRRAAEFSSRTAPAASLAGHQAKADPPPPPPPGERAPISMNERSNDGGQHQGISYWRTSVGYAFSGILSQSPLIGQERTRADVHRHIEQQVERLRGFACTSLIEYLGRRSINIHAEGGIRCVLVGSEVQDAHMLMGAIAESAPPAVTAELREYVAMTGWTLIAHVPGDKLRAMWQPGPMFMRPQSQLPPEPDNGVRPEPATDLPDDVREQIVLVPQGGAQTFSVPNAHIIGDDDDPTIPPHPAPTSEPVSEPAKNPIRLRKPVPDSYFKLLVAGPPKTFKTRGVLRAFAPDPEKPTLIAADLDDGTKFYANEFGFRRFEIERGNGVFTIPESPDEIIGCFRGMINHLPEGYHTLMIDPLSVLVEALKRKWAAYMQQLENRKLPYLTPSDWGLIYGELNEIFAACRRATHNVVVVSHTKDQYAKGKKRSLNELEIIGLTADAGKNCEAWFDSIVYIDKHQSGRLDAQTVGDRSFRLPKGGQFWEWSENSLRDALFGGGVKTWEIEDGDESADEIPTDAEVIDGGGATSLRPSGAVKAEPASDGYVATARASKPGDSELANQNSEGAIPRTADRPAAPAGDQKVYVAPSAEQIMQKWFDEVWGVGENGLPSGEKRADGGRGAQGNISEASKEKFAAWAMKNGVNGDRMRQYMRRVLKDDTINGPSQLSEEEAQTMLKFFASMPF